MKKEWFKQKVFPVSERLERSLYVLAASLTWYWTITMQLPLPYTIYANDPDPNSKIYPFSFLIAIISLSGTFITLGSTFILDHWSFCGITQAYAQ